MKVITRPRQGGKTTEVIKLASRTYAYIICPDRQQVQHVASLARKMGVDIPFPLTWREFLEKQYYGAGIKGGFVIDNLDMCLQQMTPVEIHGVSLNASETPIATPHEDDDEVRSDRIGW